MSAPLRLTADQMRDLASALDGFSKIARSYGVEIGYGTREIRHIEADVVLNLSWHDDNGYVVDDRSGT